MSLEKELGFRHPIKIAPHRTLLNIHYTASLIKKFADEFFKVHGLTDVQFNVLILLTTQVDEKGGLSQVELSRMMLVNRANVTSLIDRMEKGSLVVRVASHDDRRYKIVKLTPHGKRKFQKMAKLYHEKIREIMGILNRKEQNDLVAKLEALRENVASM